MPFEVIHIRDADKILKRPFDRRFPYYFFTSKEHVILHYYLKWQLCFGVVVIDK